MARLNKTWKAETDDTALAAELHGVLEISHRQAKGLLDASCVSVNGEATTKYGLRIKIGDTIAVQFDDTTIYKELPKPKRSAGGTFEVLFEDRHLLFVNKAAGLLTVPAEKGGDPNLADAITDHYRRRGFKRFPLFIVHRLDRFTSGVLVFGKTPEALHALKAMFEEHKLNRVYKAILVGELPENSGTMTGHLVEHSKSLRMSVDKRGDSKGAKQAITHYRVLERLPGHTVVEVKLETGRRNQIRVQFADKGFPLLGDQVYGQESELIDRQALHAELLGFRHPVEEQNVSVSAPLPADMEAALKVLRTASRVTRAEAGVKGEEGIFKPKITKARKEDRIHRAKVYKKGENTENFGAVPDRLGSDERPRRPRVNESRGARGPRPAAPRNPGSEAPAPRGPRLERDPKGSPRTNVDSPDRKSTIRPKQSEGRMGPRAKHGGPEGARAESRVRIENQKPEAAPRKPRAEAPRAEAAPKPRSTYAGPRRVEGVGPARPKRDDRPQKEVAEAPARSRYAGPREDRPAGSTKPREKGPDAPRKPRATGSKSKDSTPRFKGAGPMRGSSAGTKAPFKKAASKKASFKKKAR